jgi:hypothetical protein
MLTLDLLAEVSLVGGFQAVIDLSFVVVYTFGRAPSPSIVLGCARGSPVLGEDLSLVGLLGVVFVGRGGLPASRGEG